MTFGDPSCCIARTVLSGAVLSAAAQMLSAACLLAVIAGWAVAERPSLEEVYVAREGSLIYSGPSKDFYPTNRLESGTRLTVYHQTKDGWLGVKPPSRAFSWIPAPSCYLLPGGKSIEVTENGTVCWIGTSLGDAKQFRWQVKLDRGEKLAVRGEQTVQNAKGEDVLWYKVRPPSGEFRWIPRDQVVIQYDPAMKQLPVQAATASGALHSTDRGQQNSAVVPAQASEEVPGGSVLEDEVFGGGDTLPAPSGTTGAPGEIIYEGEFYDGMPIEGQIVDGGYVDGGYVDGQIIEGGMIGGDVFYDGGVAHGGPQMVVDEDPDVGHFAGWHAMHFGNDGLRLPWMAKLFGVGQPPRYDPLAHDPYSLEPMPQRKNGVVLPPRVIIEQENDEFAVPGSLAEGPYTQYARRPRAWRDPRTLRSGPMAPKERAFTPPLQPRSAEPVAAPAIGDGEQGDGAFYDRDLEFDTLSRGNAKTRVQELRAALRDTVNRIGDRASGAFKRAGVAGGDSEQEEVQWYGVPSNDAPSGRVAATPTGYSPSRGGPSSGFATGPYGGAAGSFGERGPSVTRVSLDRLTMQLSEMVSGPENTWNLAPLAGEAQRLIEQGTNVLERGQARLLLDRIQEFQRLSRPGLIASRPGIVGASYQGAPVQANAVGLASDSTAGGAVTTAGYTSPADRSRYDATGWLVLVHGTDRSKPPYALTDDAGRIIAYLSPLPGMKFETYVNKPVGVNGLRGFLPRLQAAHIQAERVHPL